MYATVGLKSCCDVSNQVGKNYEDVVTEKYPATIVDYVMPQSEPFHPDQDSFLYWKVICDKPADVLRQFFNILFFKGFLCSALLT